MDAAKIELLKDIVDIFEENPSLLDTPQLEFYKKFLQRSSLKKRFDLIRSIGEECIQEDELEKLLANKSDIICYDGFEPSGRMHIAQPYD